MAGSRETYNEAMNEGHNAAWDEQWERATRSYTRAVQEMPDVAEGYNALGYALLMTARFQDALKVYVRAAQLTPDDPLPKEKSADVLERLGRLKDAATQYVTVADLYMQAQDLDKAIYNWERATQLTPGLLQIHYKLAQAYERSGKKRAAIGQYLFLAFNFQRANDKPKARQAIERALRLEPSNSTVLNAKSAVEAGELMALPKLEEGQSSMANSGVVRANAADFAFEDEGAGGGHLEGPLGEATELALSEVAETVLSGELTTSSGEAIRAIEMMRINEDQFALETFQRAESNGLRNPAISMCIGALHLRLQQYPEAITQLQKAGREAQYNAGAAHGIGLAFIGQGKPHEATEQLLRALEYADVALSDNREEAEQARAVYSTILENSRSMQAADLETLDKQFLKWLTGANWHSRLPETRRTLADRLNSGDAKELIYLASDTEIVDVVKRIDRYINNNLLTLAMDEAHFALEHSPFSLPVHQRIAMILMEGGHVQESIVKYNMVANSYLSRDDIPSAAVILNEVIKVAPTDISLRESLIELLERQNKFEEMLTEYIGLADAYYQLADSENARATYQEASRLAQRINAPAEQRADILYKSAEIDMGRFDLRQAQRNYEQAKLLLPEDDKPRKALLDIYYRLNNSIEAAKELDGLLRLYAQKKRGDQIIALLEEKVAARPEDVVIRARLAAVYRQINRKQDAIKQLDVLGELQLKAGQYQDACGTVKQIVALGPANIEQYRTLLAQLGC